ncbi:MAG TPA: ATP-binding cassette domain-containing protein, partial [Chryseosolibacter sp.]|nr:ATP-binding cassette domain-containing protein [Chryseosolibacter sp.]
MVLLNVSGVSKNGTDGEMVLDHVSFRQQPLQKLAIAGETGSGKTTLLKIIAGLAQPDAGHVLFENARVAGPDEKLVPGHPHIAYLSQHFELPKFLRVEQVLEYANNFVDDEAQTLFEICEISHLLQRKTADLSGGEAQRIAL